MRILKTKLHRISLVVLSLMMLGGLSSALWAQAVLSEPTRVPDQILAADKLEKEGKLLEARDVYESLMKEVVSSPGEMAEILGRYEIINQKLLYSKTPSPDGEIYKVVKGDSLYKIAKKYKSSIGLIKRINGLKGDTIYLGQKLKIETGTFRIHVDKSENVLALFYQDRPLKRFSVATGSENRTPVGEFSIVNKLENPTWYKEGAVIPPDDPKNILGTRWMGFDLKGYGIHGTTIPDSIGKQVSAGCIRMLNENVEELYDMIPIGTKVIVAD